MATYRYLDDGTPDGTILGQSTASLIGFYNATPIARPAATNQFAITDGVTGTVNATTGVSAFTATVVSTVLNNALSTIIAQGNAIRGALVSLGLIKGSI